MIEHINKLPLSEDDLKQLAKDKNVVKDGEKVEFIERSTLYAGSGFNVQETIFRYGSKLYKFATTRYLKEDETYTVPFEVFKKETERVVTTYTNWKPKEIK